MPNGTTPTGYNPQVPAIMSESGVGRGIATAGIIGGPIALIGLILPPPFNLIIGGGGILMGAGLGILSHLKLNKIKQEWRLENGIDIVDEKTIDGEATVVEPALSTKERAQKNSDEALSAIRALKFTEETIGTKVSSINFKIKELNTDILNNNIDDLAVMDFLLTQIPQYKEALSTYVKLRGRLLCTSTPTTSTQVKELDDKIILFLEKVLRHIDTIKNQAIENDQKKLKLDMKVMDRMIDTVAENVRKQVTQENESS